MLYLNGPSTFNSGQNAESGTETYTPTSQETGVTPATQDTGLPRLDEGQTNATALYMKHIAEHGDPVEDFAITKLSSTGGAGTANSDGGTSSVTGRTPDSDKIPKVANPAPGRPLTDCEKEVLRPHVKYPEDLDNAVVHPGGGHWMIPHGKDAITLGNHIYFKDNAFRTKTSDDFAFIGHEIHHVGQHRQGMTYADYAREALKGEASNQYEIEAHEKEEKIRNNLGNDLLSWNLCL